MAMDAIEDEDEEGGAQDEQDPSVALNKVQMEPEKLEELDLIEFAAELDRCVRKHLHMMMH